MTISSEVRKAGPYNGNDVTISFPFSFKVFSTSDMVVVRTNAGGIETTLTGGTDYSVTLNADQDTSPGGSVALPAALASGFLLTITSGVPNLQTLDLTNQGGFYPRVINAALDRVTILVQQVAEQVGRAVKVGVSSSSTPDQIISSINTAAGTATAAASAASGSATAAAGSATAAGNSATAAAASAAALPNVSGGANTVPVINGTATGWLFKTAAQFLTFLGGNAANGPVVLDGTGKMPAVDGSQLTGIATGGQAQGAFNNLQVSATGGNASVSVSYDELVLEDTNNAYVTARSGTLTINSAASGANGLDTGSLAASTWYSVWVIRKPDGTTAGLISTSATAPTMPSGYTFKARVGWIRTDGTGNKYPLGFKQFGRRVQYTVGAGNVANLPLMANGTMGTYPSTYAAVSTSSYVPSTACRISVSFVSNTNCAGAVSPNASYGGVASMTNPPLCSLQTYPNGYSEMTLESSNIYAVSSGTIVLGCVGWEDNL